jgi:hypothetical protein
VLGRALVTDLDDVVAAQLAALDAGRLLVRGA